MNNEVNLAVELAYSTGSQMDIDQYLVKSEVFYYFQF
jgi:hypothetical protein